MNILYKRATKIFCDPLSNSQAKFHFITKINSSPFSSSKYSKKEVESKEKRLKKDSQEEPTENLFDKYKNPLARGDDILWLSSRNINGLRAITKKNAIQPYFQQYLPDILGLNEIRIDENILAKETNTILDWVPEGHFSYFNCAKTKKGYSGTGLITRIKPHSVDYGIEGNQNDEEGRVLTADFGEFAVVVCYVPNAGNELVRLRYRVRKFDTAFREYLNELAKTKKVIVMGDFNVAHKEIDIYDAKGKAGQAGFTYEEREGFDKLLNEGFVDTFRHLYPERKKYSWWSPKTFAREKNRGWRIDYCLVNQAALENVVDSAIGDHVMGSDHCPVEMLYQVKKVTVSP